MQSVSVCIWLKGQAGGTILDKERVNFYLGFHFYFGSEILDKNEKCPKMLVLEMNDVNVLAC